MSDLSPGRRVFEFFDLRKTELLLVVGGSLGILDHRIKRRIVYHHSTGCSLGGGKLCPMIR